ncbi:hypothetical protein BDD12DRAFT_646409, partial [Trichophaea hybrida]
VQSYLLKSFSVQVLNKLHRHLWWAGRPNNIHALHFHPFNGRNIIVIELSKLHLLWYEDKIFLKPLPEYLLSTEFFNTYIANDKNLRGLVLGFLKSYARLIRYPVDLQLAKDKFLVPKDLEWNTWSGIAAHILQVPREDINMRYDYGELRLSRVNQAHRYCYCFPRLYFTQKHSFKQFFAQSIGWQVIFYGSVFVMAIFAAQQVLLTTDQ